MKSFSIEQRYWSWVWTQLETYVRLQPVADVDEVRAKLAGIPRKHAEQTLQWVMNTTFDDYIKSGKKWELFLQPITSIHLPTELVYNRLNDPGNIKIIYSLIGAAVVIILLSCVNFMNLSTAQFTRRIKEAGVRKILGLGKRELSAGYFFEAVGFCLIALVIALTITYWLLPVFNIITGKPLSMNLFTDVPLVVSLLVLMLFMAVVSSSYPAWYLSGFNPAVAIKGKVKPGREGKLFRNALVVFQFMVSIILMISTVIVFQQLNYVSEKDLGFNKENLLVLRHVEAVQNGQSVADEAMHVPGVMNVSRCTSLPPTIWGGDTFTADGMNGRTFNLNFTSADDAFIPTLDIGLKFGRNFIANSPSEVEKVILNETAVAKIGWKLDESVLGRIVRYPNSDNARFEVIGVVKDFNYWSLDSPIEPMAIFHITDEKVAPGSKQYLALRIGPQSSKAWENTLAELRTIWKKFAGDTPFEYTFVDETFAQSFQTQQRLGNVLTVLAVLAMLIAALGLLGMIVYALEQRMKEIGIRKVSGASVGNILVLVSTGYTKLIVIAFIFAAPVSYWLMQEWLKDFAYRITPSAGIFVLTGLATLLIAILITGYHSLRAARMNPVDILRDE
jgi:putative ABC transport system permease protein